MNCLEFRYRLSTNPRDRSADLLAHREACPACAAFAADTARCEVDLAEAARLPVPTTLAARLVLNQTIHHTRRRRMLASAALALAALGVAAGAWWTWHPVTLEEAVVAHVLEERELLAATGPASPAEVAGVLRAAGLAPRAEIGEVRYAGVCRIGRHTSGHLVLPGRRGPVTVLLLPQEPVAAARRLERDGFQGMIVPTGRGSMAILGEPGEELAPVERRLRRALVALT